MITTKKNYYSILGISRSATQEVIKRAFRRLAHKCHPDVNPNDREAEVKFKVINEAYEVLSNPEKRAAYDAQLNSYIRNQTIYRNYKPARPMASEQAGHFGDLAQIIMRKDSPMWAKIVAGGLLFLDAYSRAKRVN